MSKPMILPSGRAHLWFVRSERVTASHVAAYERVLSPEERARYQAMRHPGSKQDHLVARALVRFVLSQYEPDVPPEHWQFQTNEHGRPFVGAPSVALRFNLSHTKGLVCCLVASDRDVGVDVERTDRKSRALQVAERFFSPAEVTALRSLPTAAQPERFLTYWTLKESYIKARGMGLALPLGQFTFHLDGVAPRISFDPRLPDDPARWRFSLHSPTQEHRVACAVEALPGDPEPEIALFETLAVR